MSKKLVVIGSFGTKVDNLTKEDRWSRWRPTVSIFQHNDLRVDRFELLCDQRFFEAANVVRYDINTVSPDTKCNIIPFNHVYPAPRSQGKFDKNGKNAVMYSA